MDQQIPKQVHDKLTQFQGLQNQLQLISMQKQQLVLQSADMENALTALKDMGDERVYRISGPLLIESNKEASEEKLRGDKEVAESRVKMLETQEKRLSDKLEELRIELQGMLKPPGGAGAG